MTSRLRAAALAIVAGIGLLFAPLLVTASASAAVPSQAQILFFSNPTYVHVDEEGASMQAGLAETGATITVFDGGDGSSTAWGAALTGKDVLVVPETFVPIWVSGGTPVMNDDAAAVVQAFVSAGGRAIFGYNNNADLLSFITGIDYASVWNGGGDAEAWDLQITEPALPAQLPYVDDVDAVTGFDTWAPELLAGVNPLYVGDGGTELAAATFPVGSGFVAMLGYDWFPDGAPTSPAIIALWNIVLQYLANVPVPEPALAATGVASSPLLWIGGGVLLVLGVAGIFVARRFRAPQA